MSGRMAEGQTAGLTIDARGLPCPQPVILTRNAMREADEITTLVTSSDQAANVRRLAEKAGWQVAVAEGEDGFSIHAECTSFRRRKGQAAAPALAPAPVTAAPGMPTVVAVPSDQMGRGEPELGGVLVRAFFHTLVEAECTSFREDLPRAVVFYNTGVKLAVQGSPIVDDLCALAARGVEILVCGTCLGYYDLKDKVAAGVVSNMYSIAETLGNGFAVSSSQGEALAMLRAGNVVSL